MKRFIFSFVISFLFIFGVSKANADSISSFIDGNQLVITFNHQNQNYTGLIDIVSLIDPKYKVTIEYHPKYGNPYSETYFGDYPDFGKHKSIQASMNWPIDQLPPNISDPNSLGWANVTFDLVPIPTALTFVAPSLAGIFGFVRRKKVGNGMQA